MKLIVNFLLFITSIILTLILFIPAIIHTIVGAIRYGNFYRRITYYFGNSAKSIDIMCNVLYASMLNDWFIKKNSYHYGKEGETVSSATGKNLYINGLTKWGIGLSGILDVLEKDHVIISVDDPVYETVYKYPEKISTKIKIISFIVFITILIASYKLFTFIF